MDYRRLGRTGEKIPVIGLGTYGMGGTRQPDTRDEKEAVEAIKYAVELGMTHIDTAEMYGAGQTERIVGEAVRQIGRERVYVDIGIFPCDPSSAVSMIRRAARLGYGAVAVEADVEAEKAAEEEAGRHGLEVYRRVTLKVEEKERLYDELSSKRWRYELIAVRTSSREVAIAALRDMRVDTLMISRASDVALDRHVLAAATNAVEISLRDVVDDMPQSFSRLLRSLSAARRANVPVTVSSGAGDALSMRSPRQLAALPWVLGLSQEAAIASISRSPYKILRENRERIMGKLDAGGVWRVED